MKRQISLAMLIALIALTAHAGEDATPPPESPPETLEAASDRTVEEADEEDTSDASGDSRAPGTFVASEQIRVDNALPLPVDI